MIDPHLMEKLDAKEGGDRSPLRAVFVLQPREGASAKLPLLDPKDFPSRSEYKSALISSRQKELSSMIGPVIDDLKRAGVEVQGGTSSEAVVVIGSVNSMRKAIKVPGVASATLDQPLDLDF